MKVFRTRGLVYRGVVTEDGLVRRLVVTGLVVGGLVGLLLSFAGCGPKAPGGNNSIDAAQWTGSDSGTQMKDAGAVVDGPAVLLEASTDAANCGAQTEPIELINLGDPPDMLIVLDRSGSMLMPPGFDPTSPTKWTLMKNALRTVLQAREANIRFGLSLFPSDSACGVNSGADVEVGLNHADEINSALNSTSPNGNTPAHFALREALAYYQTIPFNEAGQYVLFATDGVPNCGGDPPSDEVETQQETLDAVQALAQEGIHTFVLGFGGLLGLDPDLLNDCAQAGLEPRPNGPPYFYHADDASSLQAALDQIAGGIIVPSCSYALASQPPVPDDVAVYFDGVAVPRDPNHNNGWDYSPDDSTITFFGSYCDEIESGQVDNVSFIFGCPGPVIE